MSAQYYYLAADGKTVHGPFGLGDVLTLVERQVLTGVTMLCREGTEEWKTLSAYPELRPPPKVTQPEQVAAPRANSDAVALRVFFYILAGIAAAVYLLARSPAIDGSHSLTSLVAETHHFTVRVDGTSGGKFSGSVGCDATSRTVSGFVPESYEFDGRVCVAVLQKGDEDSGVLTVDIIRDHETAATQSTKASFGVVQVAAR